MVDETLAVDVWHPWPRQTEPASMLVKNKHSMMNISCFIISGDLGTFLKKVDFLFLIVKISFQTNGKLHSGTVYSEGWLITACLTLNWKSQSLGFLLFWVPLPRAIAPWCRRFLLETSWSILFGNWGSRDPMLLLRWAVSPYMEVATSKNLLASAKGILVKWSGLHLWYPCRIAMGPLTPCQGTSAGAYSLQGSTE